MSVDGMSREYTWDDVLCVLLKDIGLDPKDRQYHDMWYLGGFTCPEHVKDVCIRITKYTQDYHERLAEHTRDKL